MGSVYSINPDGTLKNESERFVIKRGVAEPTPMGPTTYADIIPRISELKTSNTPLFLVINYWNYANPTPQGLYVTKDTDLIQLWTDHGTGGWDWAMYRTKDAIVDKVTGACDYLCVGDVTVWTQDTSELWSDPLYYSAIMRKNWLYVHKSIAYNCLAKQVVRFSSSEQILFQANTATGPAEVNYLYYPLGVFGAPKGGQCVAVLRAFLSAGPWNKRFSAHEDCCGGPYWFLNQASRASTFFINAIQVKQGDPVLTANYTVCSPDEALYNLTSSIIGKSTELNAIFQGLMVPETKLRHEAHAKAVMYAFCDTDLQVPEFPDICACIGRKGVEEALRKELNNDMVRMVCQSTICLNGDRTGNVYTFAPSPPCAPINICKPGLDINAAKVTMSNVTFNCSFADGTSTSQVQTPPPSSDTPAPAPLFPPPPASDSPASDSPPPSLLPTPPASDSSGGNNTAAIAGGVSAVVVVIIIVAIVVFIKKRKRRTS